MRIEFAAPISSLNIGRNFCAVGVAMVQKQFLCAKPSWIEVGKIAARPIVSGITGFLCRNDHSPEIGVHAYKHGERNDDRQGGRHSWELQSSQLRSKVK